jgi:hypothetical protein
MVMLRRLAAVLVLSGFAQISLPGPSTGCERMLPSGAMVLSLGASLPGACGQPMTAAPCPTGPCAALPQTLAPFADTSNAPIAIQFIGRFHTRTPPPPEPPPPQA